MGVPGPVSQMWTVATYVIGQKLKGRKQYPLVLMLEPLFRCNLACAGCGKIQYPAHILKKQLTPEECFRAVEECGAPVVSIPGGEPLMHPQIRRNRGRAHRSQEIHLSLHQRAAAERAPARIHAQQISFVFGAHGRRARAPRFRGLPRRHVRRRRGRHSHGARGRLPRHHEYHALRGRRSAERPPIFRRHDGPRRGRHDAFARLYLRQSARPRTFPQQKEDAQPLPPDSQQPRGKVALQPEPALPRIPDGQARVQMHALGHAHVQHFRLAEAVLPAAGRLRGHVRRADARNRMGAATAPKAAIRSARTAWSTAATKPAP